MTRSLLHFITLLAVGLASVNASALAQRTTGWVPPTLEEIRSLQEADDPDARYDLAQAYLKGVPYSDDNPLRVPDYQQARDELLRLFNSRPKPDIWDRAARDLGEIYWEAKGVLKDIEVAEAYLRLAAEAGDTKAKRMLGDLLNERPDRRYYTDEIIDLYQEAYLDGDAMAALQIAKMEDVTTEEALNWRRLGERQLLFDVALGDINAKRDIAKVYYSGAFGTAKRDVGLEYFKEAAALGDLSSIYALAKLYADRTSPEHDPDLAADYLRQSAEAGRLEAALFIAENAEDRDFSMTDAERRQWLAYAVDTGAIEARLMQAKIYLRGGILAQDTAKAAGLLDNMIGDLENDIESMEEVGSFLLAEATGNPELADSAISILERAQSRGSADATIELARYFSKSFNPNERERGFALYEKAAEQGVVEAQLFLGNAYLNENGVHERNPEMAERFFNLAAEEGASKEAMVQLAAIYMPEDGEPTDIPTAVFWLEQAANDGSVAALVRLGKYYNDNRLTQRDVNKAIDYFERAADLGNNTASIELATIFTDPATKDDDRAEFWLRSAWERKRSLSAGLRLARLMEDQGRVEAIDLYRELAAEGEVDAIVELGQVYLEGELVPADLEEAARWTVVAEEMGEINNSISLKLSRAYLQTEDEGLQAKAIERLEGLAEQDIAAAQKELVQAYLAGRGVPLDTEKALYWTQRAAALGLVSERLRLADFYSTGTGGLEQDLDQAEALYREIMEEEPRNQKAPLKLAQLLQDRSRDDATLAKAVSLLEKAAQNGSSQAQFELAAAYTNGAGVPQDGEKAIEWLTKARDGGERSAYVVLGRAYASGFGVPIDPERAFNSFYKGAQLGSSEAMSEVGRSFIMGFGTEKNVELGIEYMRRAADDDNPGAMYELGELYRSGILVEQNIPNALYWYRQAAERNNVKSMLNLAFILTEPGRPQEDIDEAVMWLEKAAATQNDQAPRFLARIAQGLPAAAE